MSQNLSSAAVVIGALWVKLQNDNSNKLIDVNKFTLRHGNLLNMISIGSSSEDSDQTGSMPRFI